MLVRKTWDALHTKKYFSTFPLLANADKIQKYKNRDREASFVNSVPETTGAF